MYRFSKLTLIDVLMVTFILAAAWMAADLLFFNGVQPQTRHGHDPLTPVEFQESQSMMPQLLDGFIEHITDEHKKNKAALGQLQDETQRVWPTRYEPVEPLPQRILIDI
jgi:hypothetical protein